MQRDVKIGMSVVYQAGEGDAPLSMIPGRQFPALVTRVVGSQVSLAILPFGTHQFVYRSVERGKPESVTPCWYFPEESA